jgi:polyphosphate kinase
MGLPAPTELSPEERASARDRYLNRELSWLDFDRRVLALAEDPALPLLERVKFLAIFSANLDEFFQVRVAGLKEQLEAGVGPASIDGRTPAEQLHDIRLRVLDLLRGAETLFAKELVPALALAGIRLVDWGSLDATDRAFLEGVFEDQIFPVLTPLAVDPAHPFPYISNLSLNLAVLVRDPVDGQQQFARVKVPALLPRFVALPDGRRFVPIEQVIAARLDELFPGMKVIAHHAFRVTRDAELEIEEEEAPDLLEAIESGLWRRHRGSAAVRLEIDETVSESVRDLLVQELEIQPDDVYYFRGLPDLGDLWSLYSVDRPDLKEEPWTPQTQRLLASGKADFFALLQQQDVLVHHPYDSFATSVQAFLEQAADDRSVLAIKHTLYRTFSGPENPIVRTLVRAAKSGKQVVTLVELKARFDEEANIEWARTLERAGAHVVYGLVGLKTHAKVALVVRQEHGGIRRYCHVGTGNYNAATARLYEDIGIFSASPELGADLTELFNYLTGFSRQREYRKLLVAPETLRPALLDLIRAEARSGDGRIVMKVNHLSDPEVIDALYDASRAGVQIDLVVRGICCLRPGVPGLSENIRVRSILGRFLEHSRIFRFGSDARRPLYFVGSADLMPRKLLQRVEVVVPVEDPALRQRVATILNLNLEDDALAWQLGADGRWTRLRGPRGLAVQQRLQDLARERSEVPRDPMEPPAQP